MRYLRLLTAICGLAVGCVGMKAQAAAEDSCAVGRLGRMVPVSAELFTLSPLAAGITLPVELGRTLRAGSTKVGTVLTARLTQRTPIGPGMYLGRGAELDGTVTASVAGDGTAAHPAQLRMRFTQLRWHGQSVAVTLRAVALANFTDVQATAAPVAGFADTVNPNASNWTTRQVGGDEVYRSDWLGPVCDDVMRPVGTADFYGIYSLAGVPVGGVALPFRRALDVFSSKAHGVYGMDEGTTLESEAGAIVVTGPERRLTLAGEDHLLLQVVVP